ncbi:hypothetical protein TNCV_3628901 [Trichonephila clavipes]|nr:hypothetical protein TNCV_3628901 [Trichonephila clavipes]
MVEVKPINISLNQHSPSLSVGTAISPTLTEEFIIHPSVYSEIEKLGHAKSDVLLNESESSLGAHAYAYSSGVSFPNVSVSNVIENSSYDLPYVKNFNTRNDSSSLIKFRGIHLAHLPLHLWNVIIDDLCCSGKSSSPGSGNEGKKRNRFKQTSELYRGKYRCVQPKINLLKRHSHACETQCFPVEPSGCRRGAFT